MAHIIIAGRDEAFDCAEDDTIMRAAVRAGLGFPYECNVGSCGNCRFELVEGTVSHLRPDPPGLSERDRLRNRHLGCQARPSGDCRIKVTLRDQYRSLHRPHRTGAVLARRFAVTHDIHEFRFVLDDPQPFRPGQYALLHIPGVDGGRAYSMCNVAAGGAEWHFQIRRVPGGAATGALFAGEPGLRIGIDGPYGMAYLREDAPRDILCLAGGSGLSPMVSILRGAASSPALRDRTIHFLYGGRTARDICGRSFLEELPGFGTRIHFDAAVSMPESGGADGSAAWAGRTGFVHDLARDLHGEALAGFEIYFAGPPAMAEAVQRMLLERKVPPEQIHFDQFF